ncbi:DUF6998 domain-containing protein [Candidatus Colwellia aromaticivorans]|uniref:DUF6998 domain-containing protein n=1 Tax=Candidatus Colwellia aromaticivorans TaxID=2267621 RepID=UPI000DF1C001|nr:hypothetical protein [Candidatus Colwellia aromaticivorans]
MALTQMQIIQSLGEAMSWLERELDWGVPATELRHLSGRIGELYAAMITNGQMVTEVNQRGYDVVSDLGERISVKTTARMGSVGHIRFNNNTLELVDKIIILRINTEEMQVEILFNGCVEKAKELMINSDGSKSNIAMSKLIKTAKTDSDIPAIKTAKYGGYIIEELESGTIQIKKNDKLVSPVKPILRGIAEDRNISILNGNGKPFNTRQLGSIVIRAINELDGK